MSSREMYIHIFTQIIYVWIDLYIHANNKYIYLRAHTPVVIWEIYHTRPHSYMLVLLSGTNVLFGLEFVWLALQVEGKRGRRGRRGVNRWRERVCKCVGNVSVLQCVTVCCSVLQCVAVCSSVLQCVAVCCRELWWIIVCLRYLHLCLCALGAYGGNDQ